MNHGSFINYELECDDAACTCTMYIPDLYVYLVYLLNKSWKNVNRSG